MDQQIQALLRQVLAEARVQGVPPEQALRAFAAHLAQAQGLPEEQVLVTLMQALADSDLPAQGRADADAARTIDAETTEILTRPERSNLGDIDREKGRRERSYRVERLSSIERPSDAQHLAYKLFSDHGQLFPKGRFVAARKAGLGRLVEAWLRQLPGDELNRLLTPDERRLAAAAQDAAQWWRQHSLEVANNKLAVQWDADGLDQLVDDTLVDSDRDMKTAMQRIARIAQEARTEPAWQAAMIHLFALIRTVEQTGDLDREAATDAALMGLARITGVAPRAGDSLRQFLADLHGLLWAGVRIGTSSGAFQSMSAIGDVAGDIKQTPFLRLSITIYEFTLQGLSAGQGSLSSTERWTRSRIAANNISSHLSAIFGFDVGVALGLAGERLRVVGVMNRLQVISVLGSLLGERPPAASSAAEDWRAFGFDTARLQAAPGTPPATTVADAVADTHPAANPGQRPAGDSGADALAKANVCLRTMNNVLTGWMYLDTSLFRDALGELWPRDGYLGESSNLVTAAFGAMLRSRHTQLTGDNANEPVSALFNAGLSVNRIARQASLLSPEFEVAEMLMYATGLHFALQYGKDFDSAMRTLHGGSCLVNLLGSVTRTAPVSQREPAFEAAVQRLTTAAMGMLEVEGLAQSQRQRLGASLRELQARPDARQRATRLHSTNDLLDVIDDMLAACIKFLQLGTASQPPLAASAAAWRDDFTTTALPVVRELCRWVLLRVGEGQQGLPNLLQRLSRLLSFLVGMAAQPPLDVLARLALSASAAAADVTPAAAQHSIVHQLLTTEISERSEWKQAFARLPARAANPALTDPMTYRSWLDQPGTLSWLPQVQIGS